MFVAALAILREVVGSVIPRAIRHVDASGVRTVKNILRKSISWMNSDVARDAIKDIR